VAKVALDDLMSELRGFHPRFSPEAVPPVVARRFLIRALNNAIGSAAATDPDTVSEAGAVPTEARDAALGGRDWSGTGEYAGVSVPSPNQRAAIDVPAFRQILGSIRVGQANGDGDRRVEVVSLATQYPTPFARHVTFPALAIRGFSRFELTDLRRADVAGVSQVHGWEDYDGDMYYDFVPFHRTSDYRTASAMISIPDSLHDTVLYSAAILLAKRGGLFEYAAALEGQYGQATATNTVTMTEDGER